MFVAVSTFRVVFVVLCVPLLWFYWVQFPLHGDCFFHVLILLTENFIEYYFFSVFYSSSLQLIVFLWTEIRSRVNCWHKWQWIIRSLISGVTKSTNCRPSADILCGRLLLHLRNSDQRRRKQFGSGGPMASAGARAYNGGLGRSPQRGPWAEPLVRGGAKKAAEFAV